MVLRFRLLSVLAALFVVATTDVLAPRFSQITDAKNQADDSGRGNDDFPDTLGGGGWRFRRQVKHTLAVAQSRHLVKVLHRLHSAESPLKLRLLHL